MFVLGAIAIVEAHPMLAFAERGRSEAELRQVTRNAIQAAFTSPARRAALLEEVDARTSAAT